MKKFLSLCTLLCLCLFANAVDYSDVTKGILPIGEEESVTGNSANNIYVYTYTPSESGTLTIVSSEYMSLYSDEAREISVEPISSDYSNSTNMNTEVFSVTAETTYYCTIMLGALDNGFSFTATFVAGEISSIFFLVDPTADVDGNVEVETIPAGYTVKIGVNTENYDASYYLYYNVGDLGMGYLNNATLSDDGKYYYYTWTCPEFDSDMILEEGETIDFKVKLTDGDNGSANNITTEMTLFTFVGTAESTVSSVTLLSSDPQYNTDENVTLSLGTDGNGVITLTFSAPVKVDVEKSYINEGTDNHVSIVSATAAGEIVENEYCTTWKITVDGTTLQTLENDGMMLCVYVTDQDGKLFDGDGYCSNTYYYTIDDSQVDTGNTGGDSDVKIVSIDPDPDDEEIWTSAEDTEIVMTFSGLVKIDEENTFIVDKSNIEEGDDAETTERTLTIKATGGDTTNDGYSSQWTITVSGDDIADFDGDYITLSVTVKDQSGDIVQDAEGNDYFWLSYKVGIDDGNYENFTFDPDNGSTVKSLSTIKITYLIYDENETLVGGGITNASSTNMIYVYDADNKIVACASKDDIDDGDWMSDDVNDMPAYEIQGSVTIKLKDADTDSEDCTISEDGTYTVVIPDGMFNIGYDENAVFSSQMTLTYTVDATTPSGISSINAAASEDTEVYNLSGQRIGTTVKGINIIKMSDGSVKKVLVK